MLSPFLKILAENPTLDVRVGRSVPLSRARSTANVPSGIAARRDGSPYLASIGSKSSINPLNLAPFGLIKAYVDSESGLF